MSAVPSAEQTASLSADASVLVPWVDKPAPPYLEPSPSLPPADARPCGASDISASAGHSVAALGNTNLRVTLVNISSSACSVTGYPTVTGVDANGGRHAMRVGHGSYFGDPGPPANVGPGVRAAVNVSGGDGCQEALTRHRVYPTLLIGLPGGGEAAVEGREFDTICGVLVSPFGVPSLAAEPSPIALLPITAAMSAPATVAAGTTLHYVVTLANPSDRDFPLTPCPSYQAAVGSWSQTWVSTVRYEYLNCAVVTVIPANGTVRYEMELSLPARQPAGEAKFTWSLQGGGGPSANAPLEILHP